MQTLLRLIRKYSNFLLFLLLEITAVFMLASGTSYQRSKITHLSREISGYIYSKAGGVREYLFLRTVNEELAKENMELRNRLEAMKAQVEDDRILSEVSGDLAYFYVPSRVVRNSLYKQYNFITINKGRKQGVFKDMGVISDRGLVGIVYESSNNYATVIPIINRDFRLSAKIKANNYAGILQWPGDSPLHAELNEIPYHVALNKGDTIVTSGYSAIFPEGLMVGTIASFSLEQGNFYKIRIRLATNFQNLFHVNVIRNYSRQEQMELERGTER